MRSKANVEDILRVAVANNFNFTQEEFRALESLNWPKEKMFVNANSLVTITSDYPSFITTNPYLDSFSRPTGDISNIRACRIKYVFDGKPKVRQAFKEALVWSLDHGIPPLITFMRFASRESMGWFTLDSDISNYKFVGGYWRLTDSGKAAAVEQIEMIAKAASLDAAMIHYCDLAGDGCPTCGNCGKLAFPNLNSAFRLYGINLRESGDAGNCIFHCPDCWAKRLGNYRKPVYGKITQNSKQRGFKRKK